MDMSIKQRKSKQDPTLVEGKKIIKIRAEINEIKTKRDKKKGSMKVKTNSLKS